jgi:predicted deacylase
MQIGNIVGQPGKKVNGRLLVGYTTSQIPIEIPVTIIMGTKPGKTLVVSGGVHGREAIGPLGIGKVLRELDPQQMSGNLIAVPLANMSSFEFADRNTLWDNSDLNRQGTGKADGTITQRLAYHLFQDVVLKGDAYIDIHSSNAEGFVWYTIFLANVEGAKPETVAKSKEMAMAFGLEQIFGKTPWKGTFKEEAIRHGIPAITPEIGGGADFFQNGHKQINYCARGITNVMKLMGILPGTIETESDKVVIWDGHTEFSNDALGGLMVLQVKRGDRLKKGDLYAIKYDPTTGDEVARIYAAADGTVLNSGLVWPLCPAGRWLGILGDKMEEIGLTNHQWSF